MKKNLLVFVLQISICAIAQTPITITSSDMPNVNDAIRVSIINGTDAYNPENTGANYFWDFSYLQPQSQKVDTFVNTLATDPAYYFYFNNCFFEPDYCASYALRIEPPPSFELPPEANFNFQVEDVYYYFKETSSKYSQVGYGAKLNGIPMSQKYEPVDVIYEFPLNYGNTSSSTSAFAYDFPNSDDYYGRTTERNNTVDGWGTLTTPFGTFPTLRVKSVLNITDTFYSDTANFGAKIPRPTQYEYKWLASSKKIPVLQINASEGFFGESVINQIIYRDSVRIMSGIENIFSENSDVFVFPNPNDGRFDLRFTIYDLRFKKAELKIYNFLGEIVFSKQLERSENPAQAGRTTNNEQLTTNLPDGIYFLRIISERNIATKLVIKN